MTENLHPDLEDRLRPLAEPLEAPRPGEWLAEHRENRQTFRQYLAANPVRRNSDLTTIYLCVIGECDAAQQSVIDITREFLSLFIDPPVVVRRKVPVSTIPDSAKRKHPHWGDRQLLSPYILHDILEPDRPTSQAALPSRGDRGSVTHRFGSNFVHHSVAPSLKKETHLPEPARRATRLGNLPAGRARNSGREAVVAAGVRGRTPNPRPTSGIVFEGVRPQRNDPRTITNARHCRESEGRCSRDR